jgi:hypothetical protein
VAESKRPDSKGISYFDITDFSPGIYDNSVIASNTPNPTTGLFPAPPGAADVSATFGCIAEPNGGLGPLPALSGAPGQSGLSFDNMGISVAGTTIDITGLINTFQTENDELVIVKTDNISPGTNQTTGAISYLVSLAAATAITGSSQNYNYVPNNKNNCAYPFMTVIDNSGPIQPVVVLPIDGPSGPNSNLLLFPSVASPTSYTVDTITQLPLGPAFGHQGRIVVIRRNNSYGWPYAVTIYPPELFNYTDPPETETWPSQEEVFGPENPHGYGCMTSVSAGELFCVKRRGGAIIIQGDLNNPTVTTLPGVQSTGNLYGRSDTDQNGSYYCSEYKGAWVWNGGNSSQKISAQLDDNFFSVEIPIIDTTYYGYYCQRWSNWMLFSNNWVFNSTTGSWWRLDDPSVKSFFWYVPSWDSQQMFAALPTVDSGAEPWLWEYDLNTPRSSFTWQSLPIKLPSEDHTSTVRELVIRASNAYADAAPQIIATLIDDKGNATTLPTWTMTTGTNTVQEWRVNSAVKQTTTIAVNLACSGTTYAPVVHGLSLGSRAREHLGAN